jgi:hypothetical protein
MEGIHLLADLAAAETALIILARELIPLLVQLTRAVVVVDVQALVSPALAALV